MSGQKSEDCTFFEDKPVQLSPGMIPDTYPFKCPGSMCSEDKNNNNQQGEVPPAAPQVREMPKTDLSKCPPATKEPKTVDQCVEEKPKLIEENPPPITTKLPDTQNFKGNEIPVKANEGEKKDSNNNGEVIKTCGISLGGGAKRNCKCGTPLPPIPKPKICGCNGKGAGAANCGPNTSCVVQPLTMKKSR